MSAHAHNEQGRREDRTADVDRRRHRWRRVNLIVDVAGERQCNNLTAVVSPLLVAGRRALPSLPAGSGGVFFAVPPAATILQANTMEDNKDNCTRAEDPRNEQGHGEDARQDRKRQQEEAPAEEG